MLLNQQLVTSDITKVFKCYLILKLVQLFRWYIMANSIKILLEMIEQALEQQDDPLKSIQTVSQTLAVK